MIEPRASAPHPSGLNRTAWAATVAAVLIPTIHWWRVEKERAPISDSRALIDDALDRARKPELRPKIHAVPKAWVDSGSESRWSWTSDLDLHAVPPEHLLPERLVRAFEEKVETENEFAGTVQAPTAFAADVDSDRILLSWKPDPGMASVRARVDSDPLLNVGYRIYRWREDEEPRLLATCNATTTSFEDRDFPLWRAEMVYAIATVLEGRFGEVSTLLESEQSDVLTARTIENFRVEVLGGDGERAQTRISAYFEGEWYEHEFEVVPGDRVGSPRDVRGRTVNFWTGLTAERIQLHEEKIEQRVRRPEFLPDGRRKLDVSGQPTFHEQTLPVLARTVELKCRDMGRSPRSFRSVVDSP